MLPVSVSCCPVDPSSADGSAERLVWHALCKYDSSEEQPYDSAAAAPRVTIAGTRVYQMHFPERTRQPQPTITTGATAVEAAVAAIIGVTIGFFKSTTPT